jgi:hypothetical protein
VFAVNVLAVTCFAGWLFIFGFLLHPYRLAGSLFEQTTPAPSQSKLSGLLLDKETAKLVNNMQQTLMQGGFRQGDPIVALYELPGLVYSVGGRSVGVAWFRVFMQNVACTALDRLTVERPERLFLVVVGKQPDLTPRTSQCLKAQNTPYPEDFSKLGVVHDHDRGWWDLSDLHVFKRLN